MSDFFERVISAIKLWWRKRPLRKNYSVFYSFKGSCIVSSLTTLDQTIGVQWLSAEKLLIFDNPSPIVGDLICIRSRQDETSPYVFSWYVLTAIQNPGPDNLYMFGDASFVVGTYTEEGPF
jgi:hypothetical protein